MTVTTVTGLTARCDRGSVAATLHRHRTGQPQPVRSQRVPLRPRPPPAGSGRRGREPATLTTHPVPKRLSCDCRPAARHAGMQMEGCGIPAAYVRVTTLLGKRDLHRAIVFLELPTRVFGPLPAAGS